MSHEVFFKENATNPTAYSIGCGNHICFSISNEIYKRDEVEIKKLVSKYGLKTTKSGSLVTFYKDW